MTIIDSIKHLSTEGIVNILSGYPHVQLDTIDTREELEEVLQLNIDADLIDEIEVILELSGE